MRFTSTRDSSLFVSSAEAIVRGISAEGGLFVPESFPSVGLEEALSYAKGDTQPARPPSWGNT